MGRGAKQRINQLVGSFRRHGRTGKLKGFATHPSSLPLPAARQGSFARLLDDILFVPSKQRSTGVRKRPRETSSPLPFLPLARLLKDGLQRLGVIVESLAVVYASMVSETERPPDDVLMTSYSQGNVTAFHQLYECYERRIYSFCLRYLGDADAAADAFQDVFVRVIDARHRYEARGRFSSWIFTVARRVCMDKIRAHRPTESVDNPAAESQLGRTIDSSRWRTEKTLRSESSSTRHSPGNGFPVRTRSVPGSSERHRFPRQ